MEPNPLTPALSQREKVRNGHDEETSSCRINNSAMSGRSDAVTANLFFSRVLIFILNTSLICEWNKK
jgi:hypothetical protein